MTSAGFADISSLYGMLIYRILKTKEDEIIYFTKYDDGSVSLGYEDYGTDIFDGMDCEVTYKISKENFDKLLQAINCSCEDNAEACIKDYFGSRMEKVPFSLWCDKHGIEYKSNV